MWIRKSKFSKNAQFFLFGKRQTMGKNFRPQILLITWWLLTSKPVFLMNY